jgi:hypothetical protein
MTKPRFRPCRYGCVSPGEKDQNQVMGVWEVYWNTYYDDIMFCVTALIGTIFVISAPKRWWIVDGFAMAPPLLYPLLTVWFLLEFGSWQLDQRPNPVGPEERPGSLDPVRGTY